MNGFNKKLDKYAELAVSVGINLKEKEGLIVSGNESTLELARLIVEKAYKKGAKHVEFQLRDDQMGLKRYEYGKPYVFAEYPQWKVDMLESMYKNNYHHIFISAPNPKLLESIDNEIIAKNQKTASKAVEPVMKYRMTGQTKWSIVAVPSKEWAALVFPDLPIDEAIELLWEKIFDATRINTIDPVAAWEKHDENLKKYKNFLNEKQYEKLVFKGPGTDLECYLAQDHWWMGGSKESQAGDKYVANIPTEEVFTTPHRLKINGTLKATKPLALNGKIVDDFGFTFKEGKVVDFYADKGYDVLKKLLDNDEGAVRLGEVALVPDDSPISNTNILFKNTLFDENASCHFALGRSYGYAMQNGAVLSKEDLINKGANFSLIHVDFMVGSKDLSIKAYSKDGEEKVLFDNGNWVF